MHRKKNIYSNDKDKWTNDPPPPEKTTKRGKRKWEENTKTKILKKYEKVRGLRERKRERNWDRKKQRWNHRKKCVLYLWTK